MNPPICDGCIFYHPERQKKKCSCLPRAVPEQMSSCAVKLEAGSESVLAMRVLIAEDIERKTTEKIRKKGR